METAAICLSSCGPYWAHLVGRVEEFLVVFDKCILGLKFLGPIESSG